MRVVKGTIFFLAAVTLCASCASAPKAPVTARQQVPRSPLAGPPTPAAESGALLESREKPEVAELPRTLEVPALQSDRRARPPEANAMPPFSKTKKVQVSFDKMPLNEFVNHVFGDVLAVNYICSDKVAANTKAVTLNIQEPVTEARLFDLLKDLLAQEKIEVFYKQGLFYLWPAGVEQQALTVAIGRDPGDIPEVTGEILQLVPLQYTDVRDMMAMMADFLKVNARPYPRENVLALRGTRAQIESAIDLLTLLDRPAMRGRHVRFYTFDNADLADIIPLLSDALVQEGIPVTKTPGANGMYLMPIPRLNGMIAFSAERSWIDRASAWVRLLDVPNPSEEKSYYFFTPEYATATDLSVSLSTILGVGGELGGSQAQQPPKQRYQVGSPVAPSLMSTDISAGGPRAQSAAPPPQPQPANGASLAGSSFQQNAASIQFAVDPNSNTLVFYTRAADYQRIRKLLDKLDRVPVQVIIDATVMEVTLKDQFALGIEWALKEKNFSISTALNPAAGTLNVLGLVGDNEFQIALSAAITKNLVNVLFSPKLTVKDGKSASIMVGTEVPVVTGEATNLTQTSSTNVLRSIQYRNTGIIMSVTPTVNAHGTVTLDIKQEVSDASQNQTSSIDSPTILNRSISTQVVAGDGQTVILGGLIRQNTSFGTSGVPEAHKIPILGMLFKSESRSLDRTELVILITPRVLRSMEQIDSVRKQIMSGFKTLELW